jgi:hypothetical protein
MLYDIYVYIHILSYININITCITYIISLMMLIKYKDIKNMKYSSSYKYLVLLLPSHFGYSVHLQSHTIINSQMYRSLNSA